MNDFETLRRIVRQRRTEKFFAAELEPVSIDSAACDRYEPIVLQAIADSGWAPFHYDRRVEGLAEPWRVYWLDEAVCREVAKALPAWVPDLKPGNKLASMLLACSGLALYTWLPQAAESDRSDEVPSEKATADKLRQINEEHLAATAAAVQTFLLLCAAADIATYWGSGTLIESHLFSHLGIGQPNAPERLSAAVFVQFPGPQRERLESVAGKQRDKRAADHRWLRCLEAETIEWPDATSR